MNCPQTKELEELLVGGTADEPSSRALWSHLESCQSCQAKLDRLSDDDELTRWRRISPAKDGAEDNAATRDIPACQNMVQRLAKMDTSVDSGAQRETNDEVGVVVEELERDDSRVRDLQREADKADHEGGHQPQDDGSAAG